MCDFEFTTDIEPIDGLFPRSSHIHIFRIVQEAVSNIARHSGASRATGVRARPESGGLELVIEDNGHGFDPATIGTLGHQGLINMRSRVADIGGAA